MSIFQKSIVDKYLETLDAGVLDKAYDSYKEVYSAQKIQRIKKLKEEQYQGGFLKDIFGSVLGYTIDPEVGYNIELEKKNETNAKKADGAILQDEKVLGVIELKSNTTKNLESIKDQAFGYKNNHKGCKYVISSNFHKLRFYVDDATEYEEFDLYNLDKETFKKFYLYLRKEGLLDKNIPKLLKEETKFHEENISKQLYKDYSNFKNKYFENIVKNNPQYDKLLLFKKSQKFLDRILFVLFAEDKELIPTNAISRIVESWALADDMHYKPLYELFTLLFTHLNVGHTYKSGYEIPAYNGGLFAPDEVLDNLKVDDEILKDDLLTLSKYDFNTDVDVNILGHIFEHSLSEIEEIEAELKGEVADKSKGKRKKDGVFYTPKYITKYIVDNTVGRLCSEKKEVLGLDIDFDVQDYQKSNGSVNAKGKELFQTLESYKEWLLQLKILDPACGSGAFLNQALTFLIEEHKNIDDLIAELTNAPLRIFDTDKAILENNIFGVDINDESVEIAKLSLWLRTAQKGRKLSNLNNNIKCGNSLIDDPAIALDKAFNWKVEFPEIFANGGFDVVIGNPPWGAKLGKEAEELLVKKYPEVPTKLKDSYMYFMLLCIDILKENSFYGLIVPNTWLLINNTSDFRKKLLSYNVQEITDHGDGVFQDAVVESATIFLRKKLTSEGNVVAKKYQKGQIRVDHKVDKKYWLEDELHRIVIELKEFDYQLIKKMNSSSKRFDSNSEIIFGIKPYQVGHGKPKQSREIVDARVFHSTTKIDETWKPLVTGTDVNKFSCVFNNDLFIKYGEWLMYASNELKMLESKIILRRTSADLRAVVDKKQYYPQNSLFIITSSKNIYYLCGLINSKLFDRIYKAKCPQVGKVFAEVKPSIIKSLPIAEVGIDKENELGDIVIVMQNSVSHFSKSCNTFTKYLQSQFTIDKFSKKLQNWHELEFGDFIKELNKAIKKVGEEKLSKSDEMDWMEVFETKKVEVLKLKAEIDKTVNEIDQMVYELYGLNKEEIQIVENS